MTYTNFSRIQNDFLGFVQKSGQHFTRGADRRFPVDDTRYIRSRLDMSGHPETRTSPGGYLHRA